MNRSRAIPRVYLYTFVALLLLTSLTLVLSFVPMGVVSVPVAMAIAAAKGVLIVLFFMHLRDHGPSAHLTAVIALALVGALLGIVALDVATRVPVTTHPDPPPPPTGPATLPR